jgi:hypothetical protein
MRVKLVFPPQWIPMNPHFSLYALTGHLRRSGIAVDPEDLNVAFYRQVLKPGFLDYSLARARNAFEYLKARLTLGKFSKDASRAFGLESMRYFEIEKHLSLLRPLWEEVKRDIGEAVSVFDDPRLFYEPSRLIKAYLTVDKALELASLPFFPSRLRFNDFSAPGHPMTVEGLIAFTREPGENMFLPFFEFRLNSLLKDSPDLIGISINSHSQLFGGLTLARMLKEKKTPRPHISLGGNYFLRVRETLLSRPQFLDNFADSIIVGEGENAIVSLCRVLENAGSLESVPNLIFAGREGKPCFTFSEEPLPLAERAFPDLEGLSLNKYFTPEIVLSTRTSKGCYWQKCSFCDTDYGISPDMRPVAHVVSEMAGIKARWGIENFEVIDESMKPEYLEELSRLLLEKSLRVNFFGNGRTEKSFTARRLRLFREAGLTMILWGVESGSERIMNLINKGVDFRRRLEVLKASREAGIWNFAFIFFGFPSETEEEAWETIRFIKDNRRIINAYGRSVFTLGKHSRIRVNAEDLGIVSTIEDEQEFATTLSYRVSRGMGREEAVRMADRCRIECAEAYDDPLWMHLRHREVIHLYLKEKGPDFVENFKFSREERDRLETLYAPIPEELLALGFLSSSDSP